MRSTAGPADRCSLMADYINFSFGMVVYEIFLEFCMFGNLNTIAVKHVAVLFAGIIMFLGFSTSYFEAVCLNHSLII